MYLCVLRQRFEFWWLILGDLINKSEYMKGRKIWYIIGLIIAMVNWAYILLDSLKDWKAGN